MNPLRISLFFGGPTASITIDFDTLAVTTQYRGKHRSGEEMKSSIVAPHLTSESHHGASSAFALGGCLYKADVEAVHHVHQTNNYRQSQYQLKRIYIWVVI